MTVKKSHILLFEDEEGVALLTKDSLEKEGYQVTHASNAKEGLSMLEKGKFDIILLDQDLPDMHGLEIYDNIKKTHPDVVCIMVTGSGDEEIAVKAIKAGIYDYIVKAINLAHLSALPFVIEKSLEYKASRNEKKRLQKKLTDRNKQLEEASQLKENMLSICSHDLQTPLISIQMLANKLLKSNSGKTQNSQKDSLKKIGEAADRAILLVRDLLDLEKLQQSQLTIRKEYFPINPLMKSCIENIKVQAGEKKISIKYSSHIKKDIVRGDPRRIEQVMQNLLANAIKYNRDGGWVHVETKVFKGKRKNDVGQYVLVEVADNGRGIPQKDMPHLFDQYTQLKKRDKLKGSGLGLAICRKILENHNGNIWATSKTGKGTSFFFTLPMKTN